MKSGAGATAAAAAAPDPAPTAGARVGELLAEARRAGLDRLDTHLLLGHLLQRERAWLIAHDDEAVSATACRSFRAACAERARGVPLAYLVGHREFHGLSLTVTPAVLVPRPDTETLVDWALALVGARLPGQAPGGRPEVLDLGTGSGAIALAVAKACPQARVTAVDSSETALAVARGNGERLGLEVEWLSGDWFAPVAGRRFDLVLSNPPYIDADDPHMVALRHEPERALTPGPDGLAAIAEIAGEAALHLRPGGWLLLEHGHRQAVGVRALLQGQGFEQITCHQDLGGRPRCTGGRKSS